VMNSASLLPPTAAVRAAAMRWSYIQHLTPTMRFNNGVAPMRCTSFVPTLGHYNKIVRTLLERLGLVALLAQLMRLTLLERHVRLVQLALLMLLVPQILQALPTPRILLTLRAPQARLALRVLVLPALRIRMVLLVHHTFVRTYPTTCSPGW
jgi:hypothetical protein